MKEHASKQSILSYYYEDTKPNEILINGVPQACTDGYILDLTENINFITMRWKNKIKNCYKMFSDLSDIIDLDFSFDTSEVTKMVFMFCYLNKIKVLDLSNFYTSSVKQMYCMFECNSLLLLNKTF